MKPESQSTLPAPRRERGSALLIILALIGIGAAFLLVSALMSNPQIGRDKITAAALAQAKEALIGYAVADANLPGSLPCPDISDASPNTANDGTADMLVGNVCPSYLGRLPWKTLKLSDMRDGAGERLWYALSSNFGPQTPSVHTLNSDTLGTLNISGNVTATDIVAVIFAPGRPLNGQTRSTANENTYAHYLESVVASSHYQKLTPNDQADGAATYNDQMVFITYGDLMPLVEQRIAREARSCLEAYASAHGDRYPWAADTTNLSYPYSQSNILFGHFPEYQQPGTSVSNFIDSLSEFQSAVAACANGTGNSATLISTGSTLKNLAEYLKDHQPSSPPMSTSITSPAESAGDKAKDENVTCANIQADPVNNAIQVRLNQTTSALSSLTPDFSWPTNCTITGADYWPYWKGQLFYQIDSNYKPGGAGGTGSIRINNIGNYRAAVALSRKALPTQVRNPSDITTYLETPNTQLLSTDTDFETYHLNSNPLVNDLVLCLDGNTSTSCQ